MALSTIMTGINGAMGLYSTVKGILGSAEAKKQQQRLMKSARDKEKAWYRRNYYGNFMDDSATQAAIKRVENSLRRSNEQERARGAIIGSTPERSIARGEQAMRSFDNVITNIAANDDARKRSVEATHRQNDMALDLNEMQSLSLDERMAKSAANNGYSLLHNALLGANWGNEKKR